MFLVTCVSSALLLLIPCAGAQLQARLTNGTSPWNGRLEILYNGTWSTVCGYDFGKKEAIVACRMLGFNRSQALAVSSLFYGAGSGPIVLYDLLCTGEETSLDQCKRGGFYWPTCHHFDDVGVVCNTEPVRLRLTDAGGIRRDRGRVEIEVGGQSSTLCLSRNTAPVVCRQLGFSYAAMFRNASIPVKRSFGPNKRLAIGYFTFYCYGYKTNLLDCEQYSWYGYCIWDYSIICGHSPYLRVLYEKHLYPPLEGTNITLECESPQSGQSNVTYRWDADSLYSGKYLIFDKVTRKHQGLQVECVADYFYDGLTYRVANATLVMQVCCAPSINSTDGPPPALSSSGDEGHLNIEMTAYPTPHLISMVYLGPVLNDSIKGKKVRNSPHFDCVANLGSRASVTCSITVFNISHAAKGFYKIIFSNSLGELPFIFRVNRNVDLAGERSRVFWMVSVPSLGGVVAFTAEAIFLVWKSRNKSRVTREKRSERAQSAEVRLEEIPARDPIYVNTSELAEDKEHNYSNV